MYSLIKNIKRLICFTVFLVSWFSEIKAQSWDWIQTIRPGGNEYCWDLINDAQGNILATGRVKAYSTFGSGAFTQSPNPVTVNETDVFVAKYRPNGNLVWVQRHGGKGADWGRSIASDKFGNVFVAGDYCDTAFFGGFQLIALGPYPTRNAFIAKYDSTGNCLWAVSASNTTQESKAFGITTDSIGNSYITGYAIGVTTFDTVTFGTAGKSYGFVAKFNPSGSCLWAKSIVAQYSSEGQDLKINNNGELAVVGDYRGTLYINSSTFPGNSASWSDVFLIRMNTSGSYIWAKTAIGAFQDQANTVDFDSKGNIYIAGTFANDLTFGTTTINSLGWGSTAAVANTKADGFIAKYTSSGTFKWVKTIRNSEVSANNPNDLSLDDIDLSYSDKVIVSGYTIGNVEMIGTMLTQDTVRETGYITALDTLGNLLWYKVTGGPNNSAFVARSVSSDKHGNCIVGGEFYGTPAIDFDSSSVQSYNGWDAVIAKLYPPLDPVVIQSPESLCSGDSARFSIVQDGYPLAYQWSFTGAAPFGSPLEEPYAFYSAPGTFPASLILSNGHETDTTTVNVSVNPVPIISLGTDSTLCQGETIVLDAGPGFSTYSWSNSASSQSVIISASGSYHVTVTDNNGCSSADSISLVFDICTSLAENEPGNFNIFPNPASDKLFIQTMNYLSKTSVFTLYDAIGKKVSSYRLIQPLNILDILTLENGMYYYKIQEHDQIVRSGKLIVSH